MKHGLWVSTIALLAGCSSTPQPANSGALPMVTARPPRAGHAWMQPGLKKTTLIYSAEWGSVNDVNVYEYPKGQLVGTLTGFDYPYGGCVDAKGDVYVVNLGSGDAVEYAHGGTSVLNTYDSGGEPIGCSVDKHGDVAITSFNPGEVTVYSGGDPTKGTVYSNGACSTMWPMGYDDKGNLIGEGDSSAGIAFCALLAGKKSETTLTANFKITTPGGTMWDGKYIALADQTLGNSHETGITEATLSGATLKSHGEVELGSKCAEEDDVGPFILGTKNTPVNDRQGKVEIGTNPFCSGSSNGIGYWHYPKGGDPYQQFDTTDAQHDVAAVSIGE